MASSVAAPLERQFATISGVSSMTSSSSLGATQIVMQFDLDRNIDGAALDVQSAISTRGAQAAARAARRRLRFSKVNPGRFPGAVPGADLAHLAALHAQRLRRDRAAAADLAAPRRRAGADLRHRRRFAVRIMSIPDALAARGLTSTMCRMPSRPRTPTRRSATHARRPAAHHDRGRTASCCMRPTIDDLDRRGRATARRSAWRTSRRRRRLRRERQRPPRWFNDHPLDPWRSIVSRTPTRSRWWTRSEDKLAAASGAASAVGAAEVAERPLGPDPRRGRRRRVDADARRSSSSSSSSSCS